MSISLEVREFLKNSGCSLSGFADLRCLSEDARQNFDCGILIALPYSKEAMLDNKSGSAMRYYSEFNNINKKLPLLAIDTAQFLVKKGYKALAKIQTMIVQDDDYRTVLPHKTVATLSGIGWIGKCALLVTKEYGSALRLIAVLTNAPLECGKPIKESLCDQNCFVCRDVCPGHAPLGGLWQAGLDRDAFFDAHACRPAARAHAKAVLNVDETLCGLCISNCPYTKKALGYE